jgi:hypothetical protein
MADFVIDPACAATIRATRLVGISELKHLCAAASTTPPCLHRLTEPTSWLLESEKLNDA